MGIYTCSFIFYGVLVGKIGFNKLKQCKEFKQNETDWNSFIVKQNDDNYLLCVPHTYHQFQSIDSMLEPSDINRGYVLMTEVQQLLHNTFKRKFASELKQLDEIQCKADETLKQFFNITEQDQATLKTMIQSAAPLDSDLPEPRWFFCEIVWSTLDKTFYLQNKYEIK